MRKERCRERRSRGPADARGRHAHSGGGPNFVLRYGAHDRALVGRVENGPAEAGEGQGKDDSNCRCIESEGGDEVLTGHDESGAKRAEKARAQAVGKLSR